MGVFTDFTTMFGIGPRMPPGEERGWEEKAAATEAETELGWGKLDLEEMLGMEGIGLGKRKLDIAEMLGMMGFETQKDIAKMTTPTGYAGQRGVAGILGPYLQERIGEGLTTREKSIMRGAGRTGISQAIQGILGKVSGTFAQQGLKGGAVAGALTGVREAQIPEFAKLETEISKADIETKRRGIAESLGFLQLKAAPSEAGVY